MSRAVSSSASGSGWSSSPYSAARSSSSYEARLGSIRYAAIIVSSAAVTRSAFASCATRSPSSRAGRGPTTTSSPLASAPRIPSAANPPPPDSSPSRQGTATPSTSSADAGTAASSSSTRLSRFRNSKRRNISFSWELAGGLVADAGDPRDVVRGIALQPDEVGHLVGPDSKPCLDTLWRIDVNVGDAARGHHQRDVVGDKLERVAVGRDDGRLDSGLVGAGRQRRD